MATKKQIKKTVDEIAKTNTLVKIATKEESNNTPAKQKAVNVAKDSVVLLKDINTEMKRVANGMLRIENAIMKELAARKRSEYLAKESLLEQKKQTIKQPLSESSESISSLLKDLFSNPIVAAAIGAAVLYAVNKMLPEEYRSKIKEFFKGLSESLTDSSTIFGDLKKQLNDLSSNLKILGAGLLAILGVGTAAKLLQAINTMILLAKSIKGRVGKGFSNLKSFASNNKALLAGIAVFGVGGTAADFIRDLLKDDTGDGGPEAGKPSPSLTESVPGAVPPPTSVERELNKQEIISALQDRGITDEKAIKNVLAQVQAESGFVPQSEQIERYTAKNLFDMYGEGNKAGNKVRFKTMKEAEALVSQGPQAVAETIYGGRMGNVEQGDAYKYRGRGYIQLTGREAYRRVGQAIGVDLEANPDLANDPEIAARIVPAFLLDYKGAKPDELSDIGRTTRLVGAADAGALAKRERIAASMTLEPPPAPVSAPTAALTEQAPVKIESTIVPLPSPSSMTGPIIIAASEKAIEAALAEPIVSTSVNNASAELNEESGIAAPFAIPDPVANRGSLAIGTSHSTAV